MEIRTDVLLQHLDRDLSLAVPSYSPKEVDGYAGETLQAARARLLRTAILKKYQDMVTSEADATALAGFVASNLQCQEWFQNPQTSGDELLLGQFQYEAWKATHVAGQPIIESAEQIIDLGRVGPGASLLARGDDFYTKLSDSQLSVTDPGLYRAYSRHISKHPVFGESESFRADCYGEYAVVPGNRLSFVPKNADTSRTICTEPTLNMYFQLGIGEIIGARLRSLYGIDIRYQQFANRELARIGSRDNSFATLDLSKASDSVSLRMVRDLFPRDFTSWLDWTRSPECIMPDNSTMKLDMLSSMGNGFTFPLETLIFTCAVSAVYELEGIPMRKSKIVPFRELPVGVGLASDDDRVVFGLKWLEDTPELDLVNVGLASANREVVPGNFGVFGDDIIVEKRAVKKLVRLLNLLGFNVNAEKSFVEGPFRESCGGDFFLGAACRGVYLKSLVTKASRFVAINRLNHWTAVTDIPLPNTIGYLLKSVPPQVVPIWETDDAGIKVPESELENEMFSGAHRARKDRGGKRRPPYLQTYLDSQTQGKVWKYSVSKAHPRELRVLEDQILAPRGDKTRRYNPAALLVAFLRGDVRDCTISIRSTGRMTYRERKAVTFSWDRAPYAAPRVTADGVDLRRLANAVRLNLHG